MNHGAGEYGRGAVHTNTVEGFYSVFKRGMKGVYQHCSTKHLHRYVAEFDFRYNNRIKLGVDDAQRTGMALRGEAADVPYWSVEGLIALCRCANLRAAKLR